MHLLTLLIAAVLSSEFVATNEITEATASLKWITPAQLAAKKLPEFTLTITSVIVPSHHGMVTIKDTELQTADKVVVPTANITKNGDTNVYTVAQVDFGTLDVTTNPPANVYFWIGDDDQTDEDDMLKITIPVKAPWSIEAVRTEPDEALYDTDLAKLPKLKLVDELAAGSPWTGDTVTVTFSWTTDANPPVVKTQDLVFTKDDNDEYILDAGANLNDLEIFEAQVKLDDFELEAVVTYGTDTKDIRNIFVPITYTTRAFSMDVTALTELQSIKPKVFTITTSEVWTAKTVKAVFTTEKIEPAAATGDFAFAVDTTEKTFTAALTTFPFTDDLKEIYVYLHVATTAGPESGDGFLPGPAAVTFTPEAAVVGTFTLGGATVEWKDRKTTPNITVTLGTDPGQTTLTEDARYEIVYTPGAGEPRKVGGAVGQASAPAAIFIAPTSLDTLNLPNTATTLKVSIFPRGVRKSYAVAQDFAVTESTAEFTVEPSPITSLTTIDKLTITATDGTLWSDDGIAVMLSFGSETPIIKNLSLETGSEFNQVTPKVYSLANVDITTLNLADGNVVTVEAAYAQHESQPDWLEVPVSVTVTLPVVEEETFTLDPTWQLWADPLKVAAAIIVEPSKEVVWSSPKAIFTYTAPGSSDPPTTAEVPLVKAGNPEKWTIPKDGSLTTLAIAQPAEGEFASVVVTVNTGAKELACEVTFKVYRTAPGPAPEDITFTLAPNKMDFAEAMKTPEIEVKPGAGAKWPDVAKPGQLKATFKLTDKDDIVVDLAVTGETTKKYTIPKDVDLTPFGIKEADCPKVIKVHIKDGAVDLKHVADFTVNKPGSSAAMGVSPLLTLLAAALLLLVKLF